MNVRIHARALLAACALALSVSRAGAVLDVENRGPQLNAGAFAMRITNIGALGNPFFSVGRSFDPSFEYPRGSGSEYLNHAELWVGARDALGRARVSGGPLLEWRPTLDPADHVRTAYAGSPGTLRWFDDDNDGRMDEEFLDGLDDDGDGEVDEDLGLFATQTLFARYSDDQPEAIHYAWPNGEAHAPMHLDVKQQAFTWGIPGYDNIAGLHFEVTNHGTETLFDVRMGLLVDLDSREAGSLGGHLDDYLRSAPYRQVFFDGTSRVPSVQMFPPISDPLPWSKNCYTTVAGWGATVGEAPAKGERAAIAIVPLRHTTDPLANLEVNGKVSGSIIRPYYFAPLHESFRTQWFANDLPPYEGGPPFVDSDRYRAMAGEYPALEDTLRDHDYVALVSCGPFVRLDPGRSIEMDLALVVAHPESLTVALNRAAYVHHGAWVDVQPNAPTATWRDAFTGQSGVTGHEICYEPPEGLEFVIDPHCLYPKYSPDPITNAESAAHYEHGHCIWTDLDCDACTGFDGKETRSYWQDPANVPAPPSWRTRPGDRAITIEWDNRSELLQDVHLTSETEVRFVGYNLYRLDDWSTRRSDLPAFPRFQQVASFARDTTLGARPLADVTDTSVDYERILYERKVYPIGRYQWADHHVLNGFDYVYVVTAVSERLLGIYDGTRLTERLESPILAGLDSIVTPRVGAGTSDRVHVVPNPFRGSAPWEKPPIPGDTFTRHVDFVGLPLGHAVIRIYTLAGDLVQRLDHDGREGGEARWDLISRNGQDTASGVYLFTVESSAGHQVGRFVILR